MLAQLDDNPEPGHPLELYQRIRKLQGKYFRCLQTYHWNRALVHNAEHLKELYNNDLKKGFVRIRKVSCLSDLLATLMFIIGSYHAVEDLIRRAGTANGQPCAAVGPRGMAH